jgi:ABC-2 type transport system ATP-binding protein
MKTPVLEIRGLRKSYGPLTAVDGVSFAIQTGDCVGLLGPNGAGKTTTISMLAGLLSPNAGEVMIEGRPLAGDTDPLKKRIGLVPQDLALYDDLSARDNLLFFGALYSLDRATLERAMADALEIVGLADRVKDKVKTFSGGMKRRLNLAAALLHDPQLLLLDEPTVGVDPQSRNAIFDNITALRARGKTILYTTHYMEEVERLCDRVIIMDHGKVVADDSLASLRRHSSAENCLKIETSIEVDAALLAALKEIKYVLGAETNGLQLSIRVADLGACAPEILATLQRRGCAVAHLASDRPNLETVFLSLTGHQLRDK